MGRKKIEESIKGSGGKGGVNGENEGINPDNKEGHDEKEDKKEKKKHHLPKIKFITGPLNRSTIIKDFWKKIRPKKKKLDSNETPPLLPGTDARDNTNIEMESVVAIGTTNHTGSEEHDEQIEEQETLLEKTKEPNIPDQQNLKGSDVFPDAQDSCLGQTLVALAKAMEMNPKSAKQYQQQLQCVIRLAAKSNLEMNNYHCLLSWIKTIYPDFLRDKINDAQLGELLSADEIRHLEDKYVQKQKEDLQKWWSKALEIELKCWKENTDKLSEISHSIGEMFNGVIKLAKKIPDDFVSRVMPMVEREFLQFLNRYKSSFNNYQKKNRKKSHFREIIMTNMIYCSHFRDLVKCIRANEKEKQKMNLILQEIEKEGDRILLQDLFKDVDRNLRKLSKTKGLTSLEIMREIMSSTNVYLSSLSTLSDEYRQVVAAKIHMHLVTQYVTEIKDIRNCNKAEQKALAIQMNETAKLLSQFSTEHLNDAQQSETTWVNNVIQQIANIIESQDLEAIKRAVFILGNEYPDIRRRHVKSILCIKNTLTNSERKSAVNMLDINRKNPLGPGRPRTAIVKRGGAQRNGEVVNTPIEDLIVM
ncbi:tumor necrosis factor alpha-induced protein 2-like [Phyllobates terribilis]|uniref:tumor necrosis factor alpha-induced protein 2-like n=1 Tax=Phyllobates terribilis TaxID=111132 RepID=UPI003CCB5AD2